MKLADLIAELPVESVHGDLSVPVTAVTADSRIAGPGTLFVAVSGTKVDGHRFVADALKQGAAGAVVSRDDAGPRVDGVRVLVRDTRSALARLALRLNGNPERRLALVGITGTNGKSTTAHLTAQILEAALQRPVGLLGTLGGRVGPKVLPHSLTTPDAVTLAELLATMVTEGAPAAIMEVSSHAIALDRVLGLSYRCAVFTNISANEHLDFHGSFEDYRATKMRLFSDYLDRDGTAVINADDPSAVSFADSAEGRDLMTFGVDDVDENGVATAAGKTIREPSLLASAVELSLQGSRFRLRAPDGDHFVNLPVPGRVNVYNYLAAAAASMSLGVSLDAIVAVTPNLRPVRGRLEPVLLRATGQDPGRGPQFEVFVDFAHTPAALEQVLDFVRRHTAGRVIVLFGCGGDRDRSKRPLMGEVASRYADVIILTSDNPRSEDPEAILDEIVPGLGSRPYHRDVDRVRAIRLAVGLAGAGDVVVLAGKGHETTQETAGRIVELDDREVARQALAEMGFAS